MRILHWTEGFWPEIGGVESVTADLVTSLRERGHHSLIIVAQRSVLPAFDDFGGSPIVRADVAGALRESNLDRLVVESASLTKAARAFKPDVMHISILGPSLIQGLRMASAQRLPIVTSLQGEIPRLSLADDETLFARALRASAWTTSCARTILDPALSRFPEAQPRSSVIHYGIHIDRGYTPPPIPFSPPRLLCFGRLAHEKGFDVALKALPDILARAPDVEMVIGGAGSSAALERLASELGVSDHVSFIGHVPDEAIAPMFQATSIVLMPSRTEGFPRVAIEAGAHGRPVVATRVGGLPEAVIDGVTGLLVDPDDAPGLARTVLTLLADGERVRDLGAAARRRVVEELAWTRTVDAFEDVFTRAIAPAIQV